MGKLTTDKAKMATGLQYTERQRPPGPMQAQASNNVAIMKREWAASPTSLRTSARLQATAKH
jgi:hypothetical protein